MPTARTHSRFIEFRWDEEENRIVLITPEDHDRFMLKTADVIEACRAWADAGGRRLSQEFQGMLNRLGEWTYAHRAALAKAFITLRDGHFFFLVVMKGETYDEDLEADLTDLDLDVAQSGEFEHVRLSVLALPACAHDGEEAFLHDEFRMAYRGLDA